jgi:hypothetical protein
MNKNVDQVIVNELRLFEFVSQKIWPSLRTILKSQIAPRCNQCVISSNVPGIKLKDGICNLCQEFNAQKGEHDEETWLRKYASHQQKEMHDLLTSYQGKGKGRWDAIILFSGGKDSAYMLLRLQREYPDLRLLLMTWNNGFYSKVALDRAKEMAAKLDLDHIIWNPKSSVYRTLYRYTLMNAGNMGCYQTVDRLDGTLNQFLGFYYAYNLNIPLVLAGVDFAQEMSMQFHTYYEMPFEDMCSRVLLDRMERRSSFKITDIFSPEDRELFWDGTNKDKERIPRYIMPFIAWRPDKIAIREELEKADLLPKKDSSPILTNNQVLSIMMAIDIRTIGYFSFEPEFSEMIRYGENDYFYWRNVFELIEYSARNDFLVKKIIKNVMGKLDLSYKDIGMDYLEK